MTVIRMFEQPSHVGFGDDEEDEPNEWGECMIQRLRLLRAWIGGWVLHLPYGQQVYKTDTEKKLSAIAHAVYGRPMHGPTFFPEASLWEAAKAAGEDLRFASEIAAFEENRR